MPFQFLLNYPDQCADFPSWMVYELKSITGPGDLRIFSSQMDLFNENRNVGL